MINIIKFLIVFISFEAISQRNISNVRVKQTDKNLEILYDCSGIEAGDSLKVVIKSKNSNHIYEPKSLSGNFGNNISSGKNRLIIWNMEKDDILIKEEIKAELIISYLLPIPKSNNNKIFKALFSIPVPGLGSYLVAEHKRPLLRIATGLAVYGGITAAFLANKRSDTHYQIYLKSLREAEAQPYYDKANLYHKAFYVGSGLALSIWATELANAIIKSQRAKRISQKGGISFKSNIVFNTPVVGINYTF